MQHAFRMDERHPTRDAVRHLQAHWPRQTSGDVCVLPGLLQKLHEASSLTQFHDNHVGGIVFQHAIKLRKTWVFSCCSTRVSFPLLFFQPAARWAP